ncbi:hypothetical protein [Methylobacterium sp. E-045]|jgi:hypothetical protein|uniref:hypothetical protein n=1 Tax=Methylobacterium sp. E-045 TaxID=2836575 RepID=UPI001FBAA305|nr:hypothetical protein [Methylobacterium sp. E-045]MCJ2132304.1 hypothetical protein [Methylobacterium sp. E-045]
MDDDITTITVQRVRYDEENGISLISGADDEDEPAGYFIIQIEKGDPDGPLIEIFGEDLTQSDGVTALEIGVRHLHFSFEPTSLIGAEMPMVRIESMTEIAEVAKARLRVAFGKRARLA